MQLNKITSPASLVALTSIQTLMFILVWACLHHRVAKNGPFPKARGISKIHNILYSIINIPLLVLILSSPPHGDLLARRIYHLTKTYEYLDIFTVCASGSPIALHFAVHHLTTPWLTLGRVLYNSDGWRIGAALNITHHVIMYAYFGGLTAVRRVLPITGMVQLVVGLIIEVLVVREKVRSGREMWPNVFAIGMASTYLGLFFRELWLGKGAEKVKTK